MRFFFLWGRDQESCNKTRIEGPRCKKRDSLLNYVQQKINILLFFFSKIKKILEKKISSFLLFFFITK